jgi:hypothetical protein
VSKGVVSGREYSRARPRGFAPWKPQDAAAVLLAAVAAVLDEYRAYWPLTIRQIFYRLVGLEVIDKTEAAYLRLRVNMTRARRAGIVPWEAIRDDGAVTAGRHGWSSPATFWEAVRRVAGGYGADLTADQPAHVEVWVEAAGMVPMLARIAGRLDVLVYSGGGFSSVTWTHDTAERIARHGARCPDGAVVVLVGDLDPSGQAIGDAAAGDVVAFLDQLAPGLHVRFVRAAVTEAQVFEHQLPTAPQKPTDRRGATMAETVQAEALPPDVLVAELDHVLDRVVDLDVAEAAWWQGQQERAAILHTLDGLTA